MEVVKDATLDQQIADEIKESPEEPTQEQIRAMITEATRRYKNMNNSIKPEVEYHELIARKSKALFEDVFYRYKLAELMASQKPVEDESQDSTSDDEPVTKESTPENQD